MKTKNDKLQTLSGVKYIQVRLSHKEPGNHVLYCLQDRRDRAFVHEELMHISDDMKVPPEWVSKWK